MTASIFTGGGAIGYLCYLYEPNDEEYEEGFGPRVTVKVEGDETIWKRSRNKWNKFEKIRPVDVRLVFSVS
jgi:hypothetical protein